MNKCQAKGYSLQQARVLHRDYQLLKSTSLIDTALLTTQLRMTKLVIEKLDESDTDASGWQYRRNGLKRPKSYPL